MFKFLFTWPEGDSCSIGHQWNALVIISDCQGVPKSQSFVPTDSGQLTAGYTGTELQAGDWAFVS